MRRYITKEEKRILEKHSNRIMSNLVHGSIGLSFTALAISCVVCGIIGAILSFGVLGQDNEFSLPVFLLFIIGLPILPTYLTTVIGNKMIRNRLFKVGKTMINGGTSISDIKSRTFLYTEDDLLDEKGNPYVMPLTGLLAFPVKDERYIVVINDDVIFLMPYLPEFKGIIPETAPQKSTEESVFIGHQNQLDLQKKESTKPDKKDSNRIDDFFRTYKSTSNCRRKHAIWATAFFGFMGWTLALFGCYGAFFENTSVGGEYFAVGVPLLPALTLASVGACISLFRYKNHKKYTPVLSVQEVVLVGISLPFSGIGRNFIVTEKVSSGEFKTLKYWECQGFDAEDILKMKPGQKIFKYTYGDGTGVFFGTR